MFSSKTIFRIILCCALSCITAVQAATPKVMTSIQPLGDLVAGIMDGVGKPQILLQAKTSPHHYHLRPSDIVSLREADLVFWVGDELEGFLPKVLENLPQQTKSIALLHQPGITSYQMTGTDAVDPHIWLAPNNAIKIAAIVATALSEQDPIHAPIYQANLKSLQQHLEELMIQLKLQLKPARTQRFLSYHDGYQYFIKSFGLLPMPAMLAPHSHSLAAKRLNWINAYLQEQQPHCIFIEPQMPQQVTINLANRYQLRLEILDPMGINSKKVPEVANYLLLLRQMADSFVGCSGSTK